MRYSKKTLVDDEDDENLVALYFSFVYMESFFREIINRSSIEITETTKTEVQEQAKQKTIESMTQNKNMKN